MAQMILSAKQKQIRNYRKETCGCQGGGGREWGGGGVWVSRWKLLHLEWMDTEIIILSEISQKEKDKYHMILLICGI